MRAAAAAGAMGRFAMVTIEDRHLGRQELLARRHPRQIVRRAEGQGSLARSARR